MRDVTAGLKIPNCPKVNDRFRCVEFVRNLQRPISHVLSFGMNICSLHAGISHNKILSKIASAMNKPNNQTVVPVHAVSKVMGSLPLKKIPNFGGGLGQKLEALGCSTAADVQAVSLSTLQQNFGANAGSAPRPLAASATGLVGR